jgi:predicted RNA methylase
MADQIGSRRLQLQDRIGTWLKKPLAHKLRSVAAKGYVAIQWVVDLSFEKWHRLDCGGFIENTDLETAYSASLPHARAYQAVTCVAVGRLLDEAKKTGIVFDNFIDIGSGKGKACFYAAVNCGFNKIIGVEFSGPLVEVADANKKRFGNHDISFHNIDATLYCLPPGVNLVFLFNPFGEVILQRFLENNIEHFRRNRSIIAYANDQHRLCLARLGFATVFRHQESQSSLHQYIEG